MPNVEDRMEQCFRAVFPSLSASAIRSASTQTVAEWDSTTAITLVTVLEEEFGISLDFEAFADLDSFSKIAAYLNGLTED